VRCLFHTALVSATSKRHDAQIGRVFCARIARILHQETRKRGGCSNTVASIELGHRGTKLD
jgi:hypothetical protein